MSQQHARSYEMQVPGKPAPYLEEQHLRWVIPGLAFGFLSIESVKFFSSRSQLPVA